MFDFAKKITEYSDELFTDLGMEAFPEEEKAEIYARVQEHIHQVITDSLRPVVETSLLQKARRALEEENYIAVDKILEKHPKVKTHLEETIDSEFHKFKSMVIEEQKHE